MRCGSAADAGCLVSVWPVLAESHCWPRDVSSGPSCHAASHASHERWARPGAMTCRVPAARKAGSRGLSGALRRPVRDRAATGALLCHALPTLIRLEPSNSGPTIRPSGSDAAGPPGGCCVRCSSSIAAGGVREWSCGGQRAPKHQRPRFHASAPRRACRTFTPCCRAQRRPDRETSPPARQCGAAPLGAAGRAVPERGAGCTG